MMLVACAAFDGYPERTSDLAADLDKLQSQMDASAITACLAAPTLSCRNGIVGARMYATDVRFSEFEEKLFRETRKGAFGTTLSTLGLTSAAAVSSGGTSQVLSGLSAFVIGGREAFQKEVLAERTALAIHTAMRSKRAQVALRLRSGVGQSIAQYPLEMALADLNEYYNAGTVLGALVEITETVGATGRQAQTELRTELSFNLDAFAQKFELAVCGGVKDCPHPNAATYDRIRACWPKAGTPADTEMTDFILQERFARERALVAQCMGL